MNSPTSLHLRSVSGTSRCGKSYRDEILTDNKDEVTCLSCRRTYEVNGPNRPTRNHTEARKLPSYADASFPGRGILKCHVCGRPCVEHGMFERCSG